MLLCGAPNGRQKPWKERLAQAGAKGAQTRLYPLCALGNNMRLREAPYLHLLSARDLFSSRPFRRRLPPWEIGQHRQISHERGEKRTPVSDAGDRGRPAVPWPSNLLSFANAGLEGPLCAAELAHYRGSLSTVLFCRAYILARMAGARLRSSRPALQVGSDLANRRGALAIHWKGEAACGRTTGAPLRPVTTTSHNAVKKDISTERATRRTHDVDRTRIADPAPGAGVHCAQHSGKQERDRTGEMPGRCQELPGSCLGNAMGRQQLTPSS